MMIRDYAQYSIKLVTLMENPETKTALQNALSNYSLYKAKKDYDLIPTREELNTKLLNHYKYREIGFETIGRFLDELKITMDEIMPYYNELFKSVEIMADLENPFDNVDVTETFNEERTSLNESTSETTGNNSNTENSTSNSTRGEDATSTSENVSTNTMNGEKTRKFSDTPQNNINSINNYMSEYSVENEEGTNSINESSNVTTSNDIEVQETSENTSTGESSVSSSGASDTHETVSHTYTKKGNQGVNTYAHDMNEFRTSIIDVVDKIINDERIQNLFMLVW